jgi:chemotaxis protein MotB
MSSLVLIIILVLFYIIYQYFNLAEINQAEIARREYQLDQAQTELESQKTKLTDAEKQMIAQQILLDAKEKELADAQSVLEDQKTELSKTQSQLDALSAQLTDQQLKLAAQQSQLSTQQAQLEDQQYQIEQLIGLKPRIIASLSSALKGSNISATVDGVTGSIALESDVLFESGRHELTAAGKRFVDQFLPVYLDVLFSDDYSEYVSEIIIEGHTDSLGGYLTNLQLSQRRALAVATYILGDEYSGISWKKKLELRDVITVNGRSFSDPVLDERGREDMDASRRVVFKFRLTDEQMIQQMKSILEAGFSAPEAGETPSDGE